LSNKNRNVIVTMIIAMTARNPSPTMNIIAVKAAAAAAVVKHTSLPAPKAHQKVG
jgi:hypothetical protein